MCSVKEVGFDLPVVSTSLLARDGLKIRILKQVGMVKPLFGSGFRLNIGKNDLVTFYDGDDLTAKVLGQYGGSKSRFKLYTSTADVTIQFQSDPATNIYGYGNGFIVHFFGKPWNQWSDVQGRFFPK